MPQLSLHTPVGDLTVFEDDGALVAVDWGWVADQHPTRLLTQARDQLHRYFDGDRQAFDLSLRPNGTPYRRRVWAALQAIPHGQTRTYADLARNVGGSARAVGGACGANPLLIVVPCHRVVGAAGLGGYNAPDGIDTKRALLRIEAASPECIAA